MTIRNYRMFRDLDLDLDPDVNVIVGTNATGKSTLIEAISIALTNRLNGRGLWQEMTPFLVNMQATADYFERLRSGERLAPPEVLIELYFAGGNFTEPLRGTNNLRNEDSCGVRIHAHLSEDFAEEYAAFLNQPGATNLVPTEYYRIDWLGFSGQSITSRSVPAIASVIDATSLRLQAGVDNHLQQILRTSLSPTERAELSRQYRSLREEFAERDGVRTVNERIQQENVDFTDRAISLAIDISQRYTWEGSLAAHVDDLPLLLVGSGEQSAIKTSLALTQRAAESAVVLLEEPENHQSFGSLRKLMARIQQHCAGKQLIVTTHSNFVLNKLGLERLILLAPGGRWTRLSGLAPDTAMYFKRLAGFDTLRLVLADRAILVEGPSDELIVQRAYFDAHGRLPLDDGIDVISVGLSHARFLDVAVPLNRRAAVVTDNDGDPDRALARFVSYSDHEFISVHIAPEASLPTLEPNIVAVNDLDVLNSALGTTFASKQDVESYMLANKTLAALAIFEAEAKLQMPQFVLDAVT